MEILTHPNPVLKQAASDVDPTVDSGVRQLVETMARLMYEAPGVGLAATQLGVQKRVVVFDIDDGLVALCNPRIVDRGDETAIDEEGCLSFPGIGIPIERFTSITCEALDLDGNPVSVEAAGLLARVLQHELDHLDGVLIIDRASPEDRKAAIRRYNEFLSGE